MKRVWLVIVIWMMMVMPCAAWPDKWTTEDTVWQAVTLTLKTVDWMQTRYIAAHPDKFYEINPLMSRHPSDSEVNGYFIGTTLLHTGVAYLLPQPYRRYWQYTFIAFSGSLIAHNASIGIGLKW